MNRCYSQFLMFVFYRGIQQLRLVFVFLLLLLFSQTVFAKPDVKITIEALKQVVIKKDGKTTVKRVAAKEAKPGDTVIFELHYHNQGDEAAKNAIIIDPVPLETTYVKNSAFGAGSIITFSADDGKNYAVADKLFREKKLSNGKIEKTIIPPRFYTHIRWKIKEIAVGKSGFCSFKVELK